MKTRHFPSPHERYEACMILGSVGDAIGYFNGKWEFMMDGGRIHKELAEKGGLANIKPVGWRISDDSIMHIATAKALIEYQKPEPSDKMFRIIAKYYLESLNDMDGRSPGTTCVKQVKKLQPEKVDGYIIPFDTKGGGCGAAMRSMCIALRYPRPNQLKKLMEVAIESGRMSHNHPTGYLGSLASAVLVHFALRDIPPHFWGRMFVNEILPAAKEYVVSKGRDVADNVKHWEYFENSWSKYLSERKIDQGGKPTFPEVYGVKERDEFYKKISFSGWGGSSGHDAPMIAYDAILGGGRDWEEVAKRAFFHGGDSDSTAIIAGCIYGAMNGYSGVFPANLDGLEYAQELKQIAHSLYKFASSESKQENKENKESKDT